MFITNSRLDTQRVEIFFSVITAKEHRMCGIQFHNLRQEGGDVVWISARKPVFAFGLGLWGCAQCCWMQCYHLRQGWLYRSKNQRQGTRVRHRCRATAWADDAAFRSTVSR